MQNVLMSKLIPPDPSIHFLRRAKLTKKLSKISQAKITLLHSGAGYGKTSALAQLAIDHSQIFSWYQVTEEDDDVLPFLRHLFFSIQRVCPEFGHTQVGWDNFSMFPKLEELNKLFKMFVNEFYNIKQPLFVIIDDFHLVHHVFHINYIMNKMLEHLPSHIHFIVATRQYPSWNCLFQLKTGGHLIECKEEDFIFTNEEVQVLFEDYFDRFLTTEEIDKILSVTEGWAIAIVLLALQLNESSTTIDEVTNFTLQQFFSYLSEEIFENLDDHQKDTLLKLSIFQTFSIELIEQFYSKEIADELDLLVKVQGFIQPLIGRKDFRYHALFQQFLEMKMKEKDDVEFTKLHQRAAEFFMNENNPVNALYHSTKAKDEILMAEVLVRFAPFFINAGQFDYFLERLKEVSLNIKNTFYGLYYYEGESYRFRAQYEKAKKAYESCLSLAGEKEDSLFVLKANAGLANIYLDTIQPAFATSYLEAALKLAEKGTIKKEELYLLQRQYAENLVNLGKAYEAEIWVKETRLPEDILLQGNLDVRTMLRQGKLLEAKTLIKLREGRDAVPLNAYRESDVLHSLILTMLGENEEAYVRAVTCIKNSVKDYAQFAEAVGYLRKGHASLLLNPFDASEAEQCYLKTIEIMDEIQVNRAKAESYMGLAIAKSRKGFYEEAISYANLGLYETEKAQDRWVSALLQTALTIIYVENGYFEEALMSAKKANKLFIDCNDLYGQMVTYYWLSQIYHFLNNKDKFIESFESFASICLFGHYEFFIQKQTLLGPRNVLFIHELISYKLKVSPDDYSKKLAQMLHLKDKELVPNYFISLQLFGPFTMYRNWQEIDDKEWKREKAKELFLYLYFNRDRFIAKEEIMNVLWPNGDEATMNRDFKVIYNACLKVLEPNRNAREESAYIIRKNSMYQLYQTKAFTSDVEYFKKCAKLGLNEKDPYIAIEWLVKAVSFYKGTLLEDLHNIEWLGQIREELRNQYILVVERLAQSYTKLKKFQEVIYWAEKLIHLDSTWEEGYRLLMLTYYHLNKRPQAVKWYEKCVEVLADELNIEPMESTYQIYEMIIR